MGVPATPTSSGQKRSKEANQCKYEFCSNALKASINPIIN